MLQARDGYAMNDLDERSEDMMPLLDAIVAQMPAPKIA